MNIELTGTGRNIMNFETARRIFEHTLDCESRVSTAINLGLLNLINREQIESTSQLVSESISSGERVWMTSDLHFLHANIIRHSNRPFYNVGDMSGAHLQLLQKVPANELLVFVGDMTMGNYQDGMLETLANKGDGNYAYIDTINEAKKVFTEQITGTLITIAKDVKIQVEFNPAKVAGYRLIGYENRMLANQDFNDDKKDAGEIGAGHTVTALYEIVPAGQKVDATKVDELKYQSKTEPVKGSSDDLLTVKLRYKSPQGGASKLVTAAVIDKGGKFETADVDTRFAAAVAEFGMILRNSPHKSQANYDHILKTAASAKGEDKNGFRQDFIDLVTKAKVMPK